MGKFPYASWAFWVSFLPILTGLAFVLSGLAAWDSSKTVSTGAMLGQYWTQVIIMVCVMVWYFAYYRLKSRQHYDDTHFTYITIVYFLLLVHACIGISLFARFRYIHKNYLSDLDTGNLDTSSVPILYMHLDYLQIAMSQMNLFVLVLVFWIMSIYREASPVLVIDSV